MTKSLADLMETATPTKKDKVQAIAGICQIGWYLVASAARFAVNGKVDLMSVKVYSSNVHDYIVDTLEEK
jgi:hypothetical protein